MSSPLRLLYLLLLVVGLGSVMPAPAAAQSPHGVVTNVSERILTVQLHDSLSVTAGTRGRVVKANTVDGDTVRTSSIPLRVTEVNRPFDGNWTATCRLMGQSEDLAINDRVQFTSVVSRPHLSIRSVPSGAMVHLDGRAVGPAPVTLPVGVGSHKLRLQRTGHWPLTRTVNVAAGEQRTLTDTLEASTGMLVVNTRPHGASIHVNDRPVGTTPDSTTLQTGTYEVQLDRDGFRSTRRTVTIDTGTKTRLDLELERPLHVALAEDHSDVIEDPTLRRKENRLVLTYNLVGAADTYSIALQLARHGAPSFESIPQAVSGAVGKKVEPGRNKQIVWKAFEDFPNGLHGSGNRLRVNVESDDRNHLYWVLGGTLAAGAAVLLGR